MFINNKSIPDVNRLIQICYSTEYDESTLAEAVRIISKILKCDYYAIHLFQGYKSPVPLFLSNLTDSFLELYIHLLDQDYLLSSLVNLQKPIVLRQFPNQKQLESLEFSQVLQKERPISDAVYFPLFANKQIMGYISLAPEGLKNRHFSANEINLFGFLVHHINNYLRSYKSITENKSMKFSITQKGEILDADPELRSELSRLFGEKYALTPGQGLSKNNYQFSDSFKRFLQNPYNFRSSDVLLSMGLESRKIFIRPRFPDDLRSFFSDDTPLDAYLIENKHHENINENKFNFTPREMEVLNGVKMGLSNAQIADQLHIEVSTVKQHLWNMFNKSGVDNRTQLVVCC